MADENQLSLLSDADALAKRVEALERAVLDIEKILDAMKNERRVSFAIGDAHKLN